MKTLWVTTVLAMAITSPGLAQQISFSGLAGNKTVDTDGSVSMDGAAVTVRGRIGQNLSMDGASVDVYADIGGNVELNGAGIEMDGSAGGRVEANGASIRLEGEYAGPVELNGASLRLDGNFDGPITANGGNLRLSGVYSRPITFKGEGSGRLFRRSNQSRVHIDADLRAGGTICAHEVSFSADSRVGQRLVIVADDRPSLPQGIDVALVEYEQRNDCQCG